MRFGADSSAAGVRLKPFVSLPGNMNDDMPAIASRSAASSTRRRRRRARRSREGTLTAWPVVRVKPGSPPKRWPRASSRARCPDDAKTTYKNGCGFSPPAKQPPAKDGGGLFLARSRKELARRAKEGQEPERVPHRPCSDQAGTQPQPQPQPQQQQALPQHQRHQAATRTAAEALICAINARCDGRSTNARSPNRRILANSRSASAPCVKSARAPLMSV